MLNFGNKEFRNLQEQVLFNANELQALKQLQLGGVKIINLIAHSEDLPVEATAGDAYLVGEGRTYSLYVYIDGDYFDLGDFPLGGPVGPQGIGIKGETGQRGSKFSIGTVKPAGLLDDLHIDFNGNIYRFNGNEWQLFTNIRGPQGLVGPIGPRGPKGIGEKGEKGETGLSAPAVVIRGILTNITQLPSPELVDRNRAYIINGHIYVLTGESVLSWTDAGLISEYTQAHQIAFDDEYGGSLQAPDVQTAIEQLDDLKVAKTTTINDKPLSGNVELTTDDIHYPGEQETVSDVIDYLEANMVHKSTTINNKPLSGNITLTGSDIMTEGDTVESHIQELNGLIQGLDSAKAAKATTLAGYGITDAYTKTEVDNRTSAVYRLKGNVATYASLPSAGLTVGDVYNVIDTGINYVWNGTTWDDIGGVEAVATASEDGLLTSADFVKLQNLDGNLALKASIAYVDDEVEALDDKIDTKANNDLLTIENLVSNSDLLIDSDNNSVPDSFNPAGMSSHSLVNGIFTGTPTERYGRFQQTINYESGDTIYYYANVKADNNEVNLSNNYRNIEFHSGSNKFEFLSGYDTMTEPVKIVSVRSIALDDWTPISIDFMGAFNVSQLKLQGIKDDNGVLFANLTDDQIKSQLDRWIQSRLMNSKLENANQLFASRKQEEWITPTLTNATQDPTYPFQYMKDSLGFVHFRGKLTRTTVGFEILTLPVGYKAELSLTSAYAVSTEPIALGVIKINGGHKIYCDFPYAANTVFYMDGITYKATN